MSWFAKKVIWIWTATESPFHSPHKLYGKIFQFGVTNQQYQFLRLLSQFSLHCYTRCYVVCQCGNCSLPSAISAKGLSPHPQSSGLTWPLQLTQGSSDMASVAYTRQFWHGLCSLHKAVLTWPLQLTQGSSDMASASYTRQFWHGLCILHKKHWH